MYTVKGPRRLIWTFATRICPKDTFKYCVDIIFCFVSLRGYNILFCFSVKFLSTQQRHCILDLMLRRFPVFEIFSIWNILTCIYTKIISPNQNLSHIRSACSHVKKKKKKRKKKKDVTDMHTFPTRFHSHKLVCFCCPPGNALDPWLLTGCPTKILIRLR